MPFRFEMAQMLYHSRKWIFTCSLLTCLTGILALKDVEITIPQAARIGDIVTLQCRYNLEGEPLYTVKWYKGQSEFFRFIPKELPNTQVFPLPGIFVDLNKSNPNEVVLRNVQPDTSGRYRCEVSTDSPNFFTTIVTGYMYVIVVPSGEPIMKLDRDSYEVGYTLKANCTSPSSYPAIHLSWLLNQKKINETSILHIPDSHIPVGKKIPHVTVSFLEIDVDVNTFQNGKARLQCVANLFSLYNSTVEIVLEEERPRPRPSSVLGTRDTSSGSSSLLGCIIINAILTTKIILR